MLTMDSDNTTIMSTAATSTSTKALPEPLISPSELIIITVMLSVFSVVGVIGNALAIYVFASLKQKLTSTIFILTLAGTDFITCLITIPFTLVIEHMDYHVPSDAACKIYHFLVTTTVPFSCVVIVAIAVDRYMCICHPFRHWMNIKRARAIIGILALFIFIFGSIVSIHYGIYKLKRVPVNSTTTVEPTGSPYSYLNRTDFVVSEVTLDQDGTDSSFTKFPYGHSPGPSYSRDPSLSTANESELDILVPFDHDRAANNVSVDYRTEWKDVWELLQCDLDTTLINDTFFSIFSNLYSGIYLMCCIIVLILYSLIYRSVIAQRKKKLRIKSAQCCLLWNAASVETPHEPPEMTQDIELSHMNGDDGATKRLNNAEDNHEHPNNGALRKSSLSKARIERMRVANIKTAFTLFIVTLVFIIAFLPALLMAQKVVHMNVIIFYMYFIYNVINPFIYAFLNQNFKTELRRIFQCGK